MNKKIGISEEDIAHIKKLYQYNHREHIQRVRYLLERYERGNWASNQLRDYYGWDDDYLPLDAGNHKDDVAEQ